MSSRMAKRWMSDLKEIHSQTFEDSPHIFAEEEYDETTKRSNSNTPTMLALVIGPPGTPYANGFFLFRIGVGVEYPDKFPTVNFLSTDCGTTRMNPNMYASGHVCLSILGTWNGESEDKWRSTYSILYVLRCLQSLVLTSEPFYNEPGFEKGRDSRFSRLSDIYTLKICHETLRVTVIQELESIYSIPDERASGASPMTHVLQDAVAAVSLTSPSPAPETPGLSEVDGGEASPSMKATPLSSPALAGGLTTPTFELQLQSPATENHPGSGNMPLFIAPQAIMSREVTKRNSLANFASVAKRHFHLWFEWYEEQLSDPSRVALDGQAFGVMPFESRESNACKGVFQHARLALRLRAVAAAMDQEVAQWREDGVKATLEMTSNANARKLKDDVNRIDIPGVVCALPDENNVFVWHMTFLNPSRAATIPSQAEQSTSSNSPTATSADLSGVYEQSMYTVEAVFCPLDLHHAPRVQFLQQIFHPNISPKRGVPYYWAKEARFMPSERYEPSNIVTQLFELLVDPPLSSSSASVNAEASKLCYSNVELDRKMFLRRARQLAQRTLE